MKPKLTNAKIEYILRHVSTWTFEHLVSTTSIDRGTAAAIVADAASIFGHRLKLNASNYDIEVENGGPLVEDRS